MRRTNHIFKTCLQFLFRIPNRRKIKLNLNIYGLITRAREKLNKNMKAFVVEIEGVNNRILELVFQIVLDGAN